MNFDKHFAFPFCAMPTGVGAEIPIGVVNQVSFFDDFFAIPSSLLTKVDTTTTGTLASSTGASVLTGEVNLVTNTTAGSSFAKGLSPMSFQAGKPASYVGRVKASASTPSYHCGLYPLSGDMYSSGFTGAVLFVNGTDIRYGVGSGISLGTATTTSTGLTLAYGDWLNASIFWDGVNQISFYVNAVKVGTVTSTALVGSALYAGFGLQNDAAARTISADYIGGAALR